MHNHAMKNLLSIVAPILGVALSLTQAAAIVNDCTRYDKRQTTAEEKKIYADGYALFLRIAPPAPAGWDSRDGQTSGVLNEVCALASAKVTHHGFQRSYSQRDGVEARQAEATGRAAAVARDAQATAKANEAAIADIKARMQALQVKIQEAVKAQRMQEVEKLMAQSDVLMQELQKAFDTTGTQAGVQAIDTEARRDTSATFNVQINVTHFDTRAFTPVTVGSTAALRQLIPAENGMPASAQYVVMLGPSTGPRTVIMVGGDPARAEALLRAARLQ